MLWSFSSTLTVTQREDCRHGPALTGRRVCLGTSVIIAADGPLHIWANVYRSFCVAQLLTRRLTIRLHSLPANAQDCIDPCLKRDKHIDSCHRLCVCDWFVSFLLCISSWHIQMRLASMGHEWNIHVLQLTHLNECIGNLKLKSWYPGSDFFFVNIYVCNYSIYNISSPVC